ncbi:MAG: FGGY family carbohydrate kinase [Micropruina sp.]
MVIAIDTSTTSTKAIIVDPNGNVLAQAKQEFPLSNPRTSFYEHDPLDWWNTTNATVGTALSHLKKKQRKRVAAMAMTHQRETFAPFDADGDPLRNGIIWMDGRAADQIRRFGSPRSMRCPASPPTSPRRCTSSPGSRRTNPTCCPPPTRWSTCTVTWSSN